VLPITSRFQLSPSSPLLDVPVLFFTSWIRRVSPFSICRVERLFSPSGLGGTVDVHSLLFFSEMDLFQQQDPTNSLFQVPPKNPYLVHERSFRPSSLLTRPNIFLFLVKRPESS